MRFSSGRVLRALGIRLKRFVEPRLPQRALDDLHLPDCHVGFYSTLAVFDHWLSEIWVVATGLEVGGSRDARRARAEVEFWRELLEAPTTDERPAPVGEILQGALLPFGAGGVRSNLAQSEFVERVERAQAYIRAGDIYQVNLSHRLTAPWGGSGWNLFRRLSAASPAPYAAYMDGGDYELASTSPELFLRMDGANIQTRPIKGTRPRGSDPEMDTQLAQELEASPKENAELVMITDLLRNDLGKVCEYGSISVSRLAGLERYRYVQHLVSTIQGRLAPGQTHLAALAACFPGGSVTGAPKIRAMEIIDELEPVARGPYTGALGYLGFNGKSQLSMVIRAAICARGLVHFQVGAGIVADSVPGAEYEETLVKARGFLGRMPPWQGGCVGRAPTAAIGPGRPTP